MGLPARVFPSDVLSSVLTDALNKIMRRYRTLILAVLATLAFSLSAVFSFDVDAAVLGEILFYSLVMLAVAMLAALFVVGFVILLRRLFDTNSRH